MRPCAANTIAFNSNDGVLVDTGTQDLISENSIFSSGHLGIELVNNGNNNQAAPMLSQVTTSGGQTVITGSLTSAANTTFTLEFFANAAGDPSGFGEGQTFLGAVSKTTNASGVVDFTVTLSVALPPTEQVVTATATDPNDNTSPFSNDVTNETEQLQATASAVSATEGSTFSGTVATFTDADGNTSTSDYTATIDWGDGSAESTVSGSSITLANGTFSAAASHVYAEEGKFTLSVSITDSDGATATVAPVADVADAPLSSTPSDLTPPVATEGQAFTNVTVFHFTDADPAGTVGDYTATVTLGDGHTVTLTGTASSKGQIVANSTGGFDVQLSYTYAEELSGATFAVSVADVRRRHDFAEYEHLQRGRRAPRRPPATSHRQWPRKGRRSRTSPSSTSPMPIRPVRSATTRP